MKTADQQPLISHLVELRDRLLKAVLVILVVTASLLPFSNDLYQILSQPLLAHLPESSTMIATQVASPFLTPFKLTLSTAILLAIPILLYQIWAFVAPGLYEEERKLVFPLLFISTILFFLGMLFAYFVVFPIVFGFLTQAAPEGVAVMTDISSYLDFVLKLFFAFGIAFEVPVATILLIRTGVASVEGLKDKRPYIIVAAFVIGMLLTPPDVVSQTLLAVPVWLLFELGLVSAKLLPKKKDEAEEMDQNYSE
jgi:sec-independent protein translocase protein TatC